MSFLSRLELVRLLEGGDARFAARGGAGGEWQPDTVHCIIDNKIVDEHHEYGSPLQQQQIPDLMAFPLPTCATSHGC